MPHEDFSSAGVLIQSPGVFRLRPDLAPELLWGALERACRSRESPWRTPVLATVSADGAPEARLLVMRAADSQARRLEFHTDSRSAKLRAIRRQPRVELCFWDPVARLQLRASGMAEALGDSGDQESRGGDSKQPESGQHESGRRESAWARVPADSRRNYAGESPPGSPLSNPDRLRVADPQGGLAHFAVLDVELFRLEWLWIGGPTHVRGEALWAGDIWRAAPLAP